MKPRLTIFGIGAALGAALLLLFWLLGDVAHILGVGWQDSSFFIGLICILIGLLILIRGGPSAKYSAFSVGRNPNGAMTQDIAMQKDPKQARDPNEIRKVPLLLLGAGAFNLLICGLTFLF